MIGYWTRFAATADPNGAAARHWPAFRSRRAPMLSLVPLKSRVTGRFATDHRCDFWARQSGG
jgi:para-nitrobenzyl esterase